MVFLPLIFFSPYGVCLYAFCYLYICNRDLQSKLTHERERERVRGRLCNMWEVLINWIVLMWVKVARKFAMFAHCHVYGTYASLLTQYRMCKVVRQSNENSQTIGIFIFLIKHKRIASKRSSKFSVDTISHTYTHKHMLILIIYSWFPNGGAY